MSELIEALKSIVPPLGWATIGSILTLIIQSQTAIGRDRRQEFNRITNPIYSAAMNQINRVRTFVDIESDQWPIIEKYIPLCQRWLFRRCLRNYQQSDRNLGDYDPNTGSMDYNMEAFDANKKAAKRLLKYLKPR